ncbi:MAG: tripartite tricarboxylate transporter TctB family protein [Gemmatimonadota bacterium]
MTASRGPLIAALGVVLASAAIAVEATTFDVAFPTDPLGPKAFPVVAAVLLAIGGLALVRSARADRAKAGAGRPAAGGGEPDTSDLGGPEPGAARRIAVGTVSFIVYAFLLAPLGFVLATTLEFTVLARLFGGPLARGAAAGLVFALLLYALFVYGLGLPLPLGILEA